MSTAREIAEENYIHERFDLHCKRCLIEYESCNEVKTTEEHFCHDFCISFVD